MLRLKEAILLMARLVQLASRWLDFCRVTLIARVTIQGPSVA